jgi:DNA transformation protein
LILSEVVDHTAQTRTRGGAMSAIALTLRVPAFAGTTKKYGQIPMDRDFLIDLFADFGPVTIRRMFSGYGISADGINFALALRAGLYFRADEQTTPQFEAEGSRPFQYQQRTTAKIVTVNSYWELPARLFDDSEELTVWARMALAAAQRAALRKRPKPRKGAKKAVAKKGTTKTPVAGKSAVRKKWAAQKKAPRRKSSS